MEREILLPIAIFVIAAITVIGIIRIWMSPPIPGEFDHHDEYLRDFINREIEKLKNIFGHNS